MVQSNPSKPADEVNDSVPRDIYDRDVARASTRNFVPVRRDFVKSGAFTRIEALFLSDLMSMRTMKKAKKETFDGLEYVLCTNKFLMKSLCWEERNQRRLMKDLKTKGVVRTIKAGRRSKRWVYVDMKRVEELVTRGLEAGEQKISGRKLPDVTGKKMPRSRKEGNDRKGNSAATTPPSAAPRSEGSGRESDGEHQLDGEQGTLQGGSGRSAPLTTQFSLYTEEEEGNTSGEASAQSVASLPPSHEPSGGPAGQAEPKQEEGANPSGGSAAASPLDQLKEVEHLMGEWTVTLREILITNNRWSRTAKTEIWGREWRQLAADVGEARIEAALEWFADNITDQYCPKAYSAGAFRKKFFQIEDAMARSSGKAPAKGKRPKRADEIDAEDMW